MTKQNNSPPINKKENILKQISNHADRARKTAWKRKLLKMEKLIEELRPIEDKILDIMEKEKQPLLDKILEVRTTMLEECIHPYEFLVQKEDAVECKFCNRNIYVGTK